MHLAELPPTPGEVSGQRTKKAAVIADDRSRIGARSLMLERCDVIDGLADGFVAVTAVCRREFSLV